MEPFEHIQSFLKRLRGRMDRVSLAETAAGLVAALLVGTVGAAALAATVDRWAGWSLLAVGALAAGWVVWAFWLKPRRRRRGEEALARWVEDRVDGLEAGVITAVQIRPLLAARRDRASLGFSPELALLAAKQTAARMEAMSVGPLVDGRRAGRMAALALALAALSFLAAWWHGPVLQQGVQAMLSPVEEASPLGSDDRLVDAAVGDFAFELVHPDYTGLVPRRVERSSGDVEALVGTEVRYSAVALEPATAAVLVLESDPESRWPVELEGDGVLRGTLRVGESDRYQFILTAPDGTLVRERVWRDIMARPDQPPAVQMLLPDSDLEVHDGDEVAFVFEAGDDFGVDRVELVTSGGARQLARRADGARTVRGSTMLTVASLGLEPGDSVDVWFEATDRNDVSGPGVGRSDRRRITMYSPEKEHDELLGGLEDLIDAFVDVLADRLESPIEQRRAHKLFDYVRLHQQIHGSMGAALRSLEALLVHARTDPLASEDLKSGLESTFKTLTEGHEQEAALLSRAVKRDVVSPRPQVHVQLLHASNEDSIASLETAIFTFKDLLDQSRQDKLLDKGRELLEAQDELRQLMDKLKDGDPAAQKEAMRKLDQLASKLRKMQADMAQLAERVPYENQNISAAKPGETQQNMTDLASQIDEVKKLLAEGKVEEAMALLEKMNTATQQLMAALQNDFQTTRRLSMEGKKAMQDMANRLGQVTDGQRGIKDETGQVERRAEERQRAAAGEEVAGLRDDVRAMRERLDGVSRDAVHPDDKAELDKLKAEAKSLEDDLQQGELEAARDAARRVGELARELGHEVETLEEREMDEGRAEAQRDAMGRLEDGEETAERVVEKLSEMSRKAASPGEMPDGDRRELQRLGKRQQRLSEELGKLRDGLGELDKEVPGMKGKLGEDLQEARDAMKRARQQLGETDPREARQHQEDALERLGKAMKSLEEAMRQGDQQQGQQDAVGVNDPRRKVEIPGEDKYEVPREFRDELLKAMKEQAPERFKGQLEKYYEDLVK